MNLSTDHGKRVLNELTNQPVAWLTAVGRNETPQPYLVWFIYEDGDVLTYARPGTNRIDHILLNPTVSLNFNSDPEGHEQTVLVGEAAVDLSLPTIAENPSYLRKYERRIIEAGGTVESFAEDYAVPIRIRLKHLRGF